MRNKLLFGWIAVLLLLYTTADVTVFEYYTGNETLGIASFRVVGETKQTTQNFDDSASLVSQALQNSLPGRQSNVPNQQDDCICCCAHVLPSYYQIQAIQIIVYREQEYLFLPRYLRSNSHLPLLFRPPRTI